LPGTARADVNFDFRTIDVPLCPSLVKALCPRTAVNGNSNNAIVGDFDDEGGNTHGFVLRGDVYTAIDYPGASYSSLNGINQSGRLAGTYLDQAGQSHAFFFNGNSYTSPDPHSFTNLDPPGAIRAQSGFINAQGQVVGTYRTSDQHRHGFIWQSGRFTELLINVPNDESPSSPCPPPYSSCRGTTLFGINDPGQIVGTYVDNVGHNRHGFFRDTAGNYTKPLDAPGSSLTVAEGINNRGEIVGVYFDVGFNAHGFVLSGISDYAHPSAWTTIDVTIDGFPPAAATEINSINERGQITGYYIDGNGITHGFIGTPEH
jgi:probable HAF family extracellular repeat protein